jgi:hypothetical protein
MCCSVLLFRQSGPAHVLVAEGCRRKGTEVRGGEFLHVRCHPHRLGGEGARLTAQVVEVLEGVAQAHYAGDNVHDGPEPVRVDERSLVGLEPAHLHDRHLALEGLHVGRVHLSCARRWE